MPRTACRADDGFLPSVIILIIDIDHGDQYALWSCFPMVWSQGALTIIRDSQHLFLAFSLFFKELDLRLGVSECRLCGSGVPTSGVVRRVRRG